MRLSTAWDEEENMFWFQDKTTLLKSNTSGLHFHWNWETWKCEENEGARYGLFQSQGRKGNSRQISQELNCGPWETTQPGNFPLIKYMGNEKPCALWGSHKLLESGLETDTGVCGKGVPSQGTRRINDTFTLKGTTVPNLWPPVT